MTPGQSRHFPWFPALLALLAVTFLVLMARTGHLPETRQLVKFTGKGVLKALPEQVQHVVITRQEGTAVFVRHPEHGWIQRDGHGLHAAALHEHLTMALLLMHASEPIRILSYDEYRDTSLQEFGLAQPRYYVLLADARSTLLEAHFGSLNHQELLQYMRLTGGDEVYLMSRFVGQAWEHIWEHTSAPTTRP